MANLPARSGDCDADSVDETGTAAAGLICSAVGQIARLRHAHVRRIGWLMSTRLDAKGRTVLALEAGLDVTQSKTLADALLKLRGKDIVVDASEVQHLGAQCGQVLVSAKRTWTADGRAMRFEQASAEFNEGLRLLGLTSILPVEEHTS